MGYVNVGVYVNEERPKSKKALRDAVASVRAGDTSVRVSFDSTAMMGPRRGDRIRCLAEDIGGDTLQVCGPDPYTSRRWYAAVRVASKGGCQVITVT